MYIQGHAFMSFWVYFYLFNVKYNYDLGVGHPLSHNQKHKDSTIFGLGIPADVCDEIDAKVIQLNTL